MKRYKNGNYFVTIFNDGTKMRQTDDNEFIPDFSENVDVCITKKCSQMCKFCYEGCTANGLHADLFKFPFINTLHPYTEVALNGNDCDHPDFEKFLEHLKSKNIFTNITVNQNQFINNFDKIKDWQNKKYIYGIGVSLIKPTEQLINLMKKIDNTVLHTIIGILSEDDIKILSDKDIKVLILGYKDLQRGITYKESNKELINKNSKYLYDNIEEIIKHFSVTSFDNLALEQLNIKRILSDKEWESFYMGDDGNFTFYIDMVAGKFAKNSLSTERFDIGDKSIDDMFNFIREKYNKNLI